MMDKPALLTLFIFGCLVRRSDCGHTPSIPNGAIILSQPGHTKYGDVANVICDAGHISNASQVTCESTAKWKLTSCEPRDCGSTPSIPNGSIILSQPGRTKYGDVADVTCVDGHISNASQVTCESTGKWKVTSCELRAHNVAIGKNSTQSDTANGRVAALGNDGDRSTCTDTMSSDASWEVDLGGVFQIESVIVREMVPNVSEEGQWISRVINFSSQYGPKDWSAQQIIGVPNVYPIYMDHHKAWAPKDKNANEFLEFEFPHIVNVSKIDIYETFNAGGVKAVKCYDVTSRWITLWSTHEVSVIYTSRIFSPTFTSPTPCFSNRIRLDIDSTHDWVEIDAVRLHGYKGSPLRNMQVYLGPSTDQYSLAGFHAGIIVGDVEVNVSGVNIARFVKVKMDPSVSPLRLCEVMVLSLKEDNCKTLQIQANGALKSGTYTVQNRDGQSYRIYCQFYDGYGYTFLSASTKVSVNMLSLYDDKSHVIIRHKRSNGYQYTSTMAQLGIYASTPVSVQYSACSLYQGPQNSNTPYIFVGFIPKNMTYMGAVQGWKVNGEELTFENCDGNANSYISFFFNPSGQEPIDLVGERKQLLYHWYDNASVVAQSEYLPDEFFANYHEVHQGGCGGVGRGPIRGAVGMKFTISRLTDKPTTATQETHDTSRTGTIVAASLSSVIGLLVSIIAVYIYVKRIRPQSSAHQPNEVTKRSTKTTERPDDRRSQNDYILPSKRPTLKTPEPIMESSDDLCSVYASVEEDPYDYINLREISPPTIESDEDRVSIYASVEDNPSGKINPTYDDGYLDLTLAAKYKTNDA